MREVFPVMNYKKTLLLPKSSFSKDPPFAFYEKRTLAFWEGENIYERVLESRKRAPLFVLHDGPPYSNSPIEMLHAFNKILKDFIIRFKTLDGYKVPFIPGWDTHGLPNEIQTIKAFGLTPQRIEPLKLREYATKLTRRYVDIQREQFMRLGVMGDWKNPYLTMDPSYEATVVRVFKRLTQEQFVYQGIKPVYWCTHCRTALAEAEVKYKACKLRSLYIKFPLLDRDMFPTFSKPIYILVWLNRAWTLLGLEGIVFNPYETYCLLSGDSEGLILSEALLSMISEKAEIEDYEVITSFTGKELSGKRVLNLVDNREILLFPKEHVSMDYGTGFLTISPGFSPKDFELAIEYNLPIKTLIDEKGNFTLEGKYKGLHYKEAEERIIFRLLEKEAILLEETVHPSDAHCWRCGNPLIYRSTPQWFIAVDVNNLRARVVESIKEVNWVPPWGKDRITNMVKNRPDWCISRQRVWGVPIPVLQCEECGKGILDYNVIEKAEKIFEKEGTDAWFKRDVKDFAGDNFSCPHCNSKRVKKGEEIFDVWFEAGISYEAVLRKKGLKFPADLYVEGTHQHRGWFQASLFPSVAIHRKAPFKQVLTHGWVLNTKGRALDPISEGFTDPMELVEEFGADVMRLYFAMTSCTQDIKVGRKTMEMAQNVLKRIRGRLKYMLGVLNGFDPEKYIHIKLPFLEKWLLFEYNKNLKLIKKWYDEFKFHWAYEKILHLLNHVFSKQYLRWTKDILYADPPPSPRRLASQMAIYKFLRGITTAIAPIIPFTAEEVWQSYAPFKREFPSVMMAKMESIDVDFKEPEFNSALYSAHSVDTANKEFMKEKSIDTSKKLELTFYVENFEKYARWDDFLERYLDVYKINWEVGKKPKKTSKDTRIIKSIYMEWFTISEGKDIKECKRCGRYFKGKEEICKRCSQALLEMEKLNN